MSSTTSNAPDERQLALLQASARGQEARVKSLLAESVWESRMDSVALRHSLQKVAARRGNVALNLSLAQLLLEKGADVNPALNSNEVSALIKAAESGSAPLVELLLRSEKITGKAIHIGSRDKNGRNALFAAAWHGSEDVVRLLLEAKVPIDARDKEGRTTLVHLAAEKMGRWKSSMIELLLSNGADIEAVDQTKRTALLWAAATNKVDLCVLLLSGSRARPANVRATNNRGKTALQMAAEQGHAGIVKALLDANADPTLISDGQWTALHNAAEKGHLEVVRLLLDSHADVNAETSSGMTALHWAAQNGHKGIVELIMQKPDVILAGRDAFMSTPLLRAAERGHEDIVHMLSPYKMWDRLSHAAQQACKMEATVVDFGVAPSEKNLEHRKGQLVYKQSVADLLYGWDSKNEKPTISCLAKNIKSKPAFRWIHLPTNNLEWVQTLLTKAFIEGGARDVDDFKSLEKCFAQEHRGPTVHAHFMRTYCQRMGMSVAEKQNPRLSPANAQSPFASPSPAAAAAVERLQAEGSSSDHAPGTPRRSSAAPKEPLSKNQQRKAKRQTVQGREPPQTQRQQSDLSASLSSVRSRKDTWRPPSSPKPDPRFGDKHGKLVFFMPYLHYETDDSRRKMSQVIRATLKQDFQRLHASYPTADENLIEAYLLASPQLHIRRTLDQFFYHGIDTKDRDIDQVVYRYCERLQKQGHKTDKKVFMVDQLWCFVLSSELIVTCFPQRWQQPKNDPLNVLDGVIEDINSKTRPPVSSVYDLAMLISSRCSSVFDQNRIGQEDFQFMDMFDTSIGVVTNRETKLFRRFNAASAAAARWLKLHRRARTSEEKLTDASFEDKQHKHNTSFVDELLNIDTETELLAEIKDIRDELQMIEKVLKEQRHIIPDLADKIKEEVGGQRSPAASDVQRKKQEQLKAIETHIKDVERMDMQAEGIYTSLTHLLDLKQKHANAFEARFARDQAELQARQGQTIMVFTIVTIVFLPLSFMAAFFTINIEEFPKAAGGNNQLNLNWVSKYLFGIGLAISVPLIALAFSVHDIVNLYRDIRERIQLSLSQHHRRKKPEIDIAVSPPELDDYPTGRISRSSHRRRRSDAYTAGTGDYEKVNGRVNHLSPGPPGSKGFRVDDDQQNKGLDFSPERDFPQPTRQWSRRTEFSWRLDGRARNSRDTDRFGMV